MATTKSVTASLADIGGGFRLGDYGILRTSVLYSNNAISTYGITAAGSTQATSTPLFSVYNQVDAATAGQGISLPSSTGKTNVPYQNVVVINNTSVILSIYGAIGTSDTINGVAGSTAFPLAPGSLTIFNSAKPGGWFSEGANTFFATGQTGTFTANGATPVTVGNVNITANSQVLVTLKTVGGTVGTSAPNVRTITVGTGFTIAGIASDTSVYNYAIIG